MSDSAGAMQAHVHHFTKRVAIAARCKHGKHYILAWKCEECGYKEAYDLTHELPAGAKR